MLSIELLGSLIIGSLIFIILTFSSTIETKKGCEILMKSNVEMLNNLDLKFDKVKPPQDNSLKTLVSTFMFIIGLFI